MKIVNYKDADEINYVYAICKCTKLGEAVEVPRPDYAAYIRFKCPRCGTQLGIIADGKFELSP